MLACLLSDATSGAGLTDGVRECGEKIDAIERVKESK